MQSEQKNWPSDLNHCVVADHERAGKAPHYGVRGYVTKLCLYCVIERTGRFGTLEKALETFAPDLSANKVKA